MGLAGISKSTVSKLCKDIDDPPDGRHAVSDSEARTLKVWDLASGAEICAPLVGDHPMLCVATVSDWLFVVGDLGGAVHVLDLVEPQGA